MYNCALSDSITSMAKKKGREVATEHISFRLTPEFSKDLMKYARIQVDDSGRSLTLGQAARKIVVQFLIEKRKIELENEK